jgi:hypothetical protein
VDEKEDFVVEYVGKMDIVVDWDGKDVLVVWPGLHLQIVTPVSATKNHTNKVLTSMVTVVN